MGWVRENSTLSGGQWLVGGAAKLALTPGLQNCRPDERCLLDVVLAGCWSGRVCGIVALKLGGPAYHLTRFKIVWFSQGSLKDVWPCLKLRREMQNLVLGF